MYFGSKNFQTILRHFMREKCYLANFRQMRSSEKKKITT